MFEIRVVRTRNEIDHHVWDSLLARKEAPLFHKPQFILICITALDGGNLQRLCCHETIKSEIKNILYE